MSLGKALLRSHRLRCEGSSSSSKDQSNKKYFMKHEQKDIAEFLEMKKFFEENEESDELVASCFPSTELYERFCGMKSNPEELVHADISRSDAPIYLKIPQRPDWHYEEDSDVVLSRESESFSKWRGAMREIEQNSAPAFCLYEKNIELWRQLWRVTERCDFIMQVLDCRNPNAYRCLDLEEIIADKNKMLIYVLNKADLIDGHQRAAWATYLKGKKKNFVFFASKTEGDPFSKEFLGEDAVPETKKKSGRISARLRGAVRQGRPAGHANEAVAPPVVPEAPAGIDVGEESLDCPTRHDLFDHLREVLQRELSFFNSPEVCTVAQVHTMLKAIETVKRKVSARFTAKAEAEADEKHLLKVGLIGFPNVGKSSFFNSLINRKKAATGARPGKTKYFQSMYLPGSESIVLHDSPGILFPSLSRSRSSALCEGKVSIQQSKNHEQCLIEACKRVGLAAIEARYKIRIQECKKSRLADWVDALLTTYAYSRGHIGAFNVPLKSQAGVRILQDYVKGHLVYASPPPMESDAYADILAILQHSPIGERCDDVFGYIEKLFMEKGLPARQGVADARDFFIPVELSPIAEQPYLYYELYFNL